MADGTGLPFTYEQLKTQNYNLVELKKKFGKMWLKNNLDTEINWEVNIGKNQYGYVEMEPIDYTLRDLISDKKFTLDMFFEIIYTKLCLQIIGNVITPDDHAENVMTSLCSNVRKYIIKSRGHEYKFFISDPNKIKYIDLERTDIVKDRNYLSAETAFYWHYNKEHVRGYSSNEDKTYADIIMITLFNNTPNQRFNLNRFCEFMHKILPDKYTDESLYVNKPIEEYYLDMDVLDNTIQPNMLFQPRSTDIPKGNPYKLWNGTLEFPPLPTVAPLTSVTVVGGDKQKYKLKIFEW